MKVRILDLDNCVSDDEWRIPRIKWDEEDLDKRYHDYHSLCDMDKIGNADLLKDKSVDLFVFFTARPEKYRDHTLKWIGKMSRELWRGQKEHSILMMRQEGDHSHSVYLKCKMLADLLERHRFKIGDIEAFDDREDVVAMYRRSGIKAEVRKIHDTCAYTKPVDRPKCFGNFALGSNAAERCCDDCKLHGDCTTATLEKSVRPSRKEIKTAADILIEMGNTYRERNKVYGDNYKRVGHVMKALHPEGVELKTPEDHEMFHLWSLIIVKISRFAVSGLTHEDSCHDAAVYLAMCEAILKGRNLG